MNTVVAIAAPRTASTFCGSAKDVLVAVKEEKEEDEGERNRHFAHRLLLLSWATLQEISGTRLVEF